MAMFQASHPGLALTPEKRSPSLALGGDGPDDLNTLLYPFRHPDRSRWTSNDVSNAESIFKYGYSYPEVPPGFSTNDLQAHATTQANQLYGPQPVTAALFRSDDSGVPNGEFLPVRETKGVMLTASSTNQTPRMVR